MSFERSPSGQANRALFFRADLVCYTEGEPNCEFGIDISFWSAIFETLAPNLTIHFTARGGKPNLENLATEVIANDILNTIVVMDRDYSEFRLGAFIDDPRVFYTHGYSWENDVFCASQSAKVATRISRGTRLPAAKLADLRDDIERLDKKCAKPILADFAALLRGGSVFDRDKPGRYSYVLPNGRPDFALERCFADLCRAKGKLKGRDIRPHVDAPKQGSRYLWGKAYEAYVRIGIHKSVREVGAKPVGHEHLRDVAISCFAHCLSSGQNSPELNHYRASWQSYAEAYR